MSVGLLRKGPVVKLAVPRRLKELIEEYGTQFVPLAGESEDLSHKMNDTGFNSIKMVREFMGHAIEIGADVLRQVEEACRDADLIIHAFAHAVGTHTLAREMKIPDIHIQTFPMFTPRAITPMSHYLILNCHR